MTISKNYTRENVYDLTCSTCCTFRHNVYKVSMVSSLLKSTLLFCYISLRSSSHVQSKTLCKLYGFLHATSCHSKSSWLPIFFNASIQPSTNAYANVCQESYSKCFFYKYMCSILFSPSSCHRYCSLKVTTFYEVLDITNVFE